MVYIFHVVLIINLKVHSKSTAIYQLSASYLPRSSIPSFPQPQSSLLVLGAHSLLVSVRIRARTAGGIPASRTAHDRTPGRFCLTANVRICNSRNSLAGAATRSPLKTVHWTVFRAFRTHGACSFSDDLTSDGISATGCPQRFAHWADASFVCLSNASHCLRSGEPLFRNLSRRSRPCWRYSPLLASIDSLRALLPIGK